MPHLHLLGADVPSGLDVWGPTIAQLGVAGLVLWYVGNKLIPKLLDANAETIRAFRDEMREQREHDDTRTAETHKRISELSTEVRRLADHSLKAA